jgi:acetyl-CoA synthetase
VLDSKGVWHPSAKQVGEAKLTRLALSLGVGGFDELYDLSLSDPERYWRGLSAYAGFIWSRPFAKVLDVSAGKPFPRWFAGGELNFVDSILAKADDPPGPALILEREPGEVTETGYPELAAAIRRHAAGLRQAGVGRGDTVGLLFQPGVEVVVSLLAIAALGAIAVPLFSGFGVDSVVARLGACKAKVFIASTGFPRRGKMVDLRDTIAKAVARLPDLQLLVISDAYGLGDVPSTGSVRTAAWTQIDAEPAASIPVRMDPNDPFLILYTSGTTGAPKGTVHIHGGFPLKIINDVTVHFDVGRGDRWLLPGDMGWVAGPVTVIGALLVGATLILYDGAPNWPDWGRFGEVIARAGVTHLGASPTLIRGMAANLAEATRADLSSLRLLITAGEAISPEHFLWYSRTFGRGEAPVINYTGGTEVSGGLLGNVPVRAIVPACFNAVSPGVQVEVLDADGAPLLDASGELVVKEPLVGMTQGFWQDRNRYLETYWEKFPGKWAHGDLAQQGRDGQFQMLGRADDVMKIAGKRVGPAEIEDVLAAAEGIAEAAAISVPDPLKGESLVVFFVGDPAAAGWIVRTLEDGMGRAFRPAAVHNVAELPKTRSNKILRRILRRAYLGEPLGDTSALANPETLAVIADHGAGWSAPKP